MKICHISTYPPEKDGVAVYTSKIVNLLQKKGIDNKIISFKEKKEKNSEDKKIYPILGKSPLYLFTAYKTLKKINPEIIHIQYAISMYRLLGIFLWILILFYKKTNKIIIVSTFHEVKRDTDKLGKIGYFYYGQISKAIDQIYVLTMQSKKILSEKCNVKKEKIKIIPHGIYKFDDEENLAKTIRKNLKINQKKVILYFGYIGKDKGIEYFIKSAYHFFKKNPSLKGNIIFLIAGEVRPRKGLFKIFQKKDKDYLSFLHNEVTRYNLEKNILFTGYVENKNLYSLFKLSKIVVMPYKNAEQSGVLNWALASGKPIIASDVGGLKETLYKVGILVPSCDSKQIAYEIDKLLSNPTYYNKIEKNYTNLKKEQSMYNVVKKLIKSYLKLTK